MRIQDLFSPEDVTLLQQRSERIASSIENDDKSGYISVLTAVLQHENYAIPIDAITAVYEDILIIPIPGAPKYVQGVANLRGHIITVLNLSSLLGLDSEDVSIGTVLAASSKYGNVGLSVEAIGEVIELPFSQLNSTPANANFDHPDYFQGIFIDGTALLDLSNILNSPQLLVNDGGT